MEEKTLLRLRRGVAHAQIGNPGGAAGAETFVGSRIDARLGGSMATVWITDVLTALQRTGCYAVRVSWSSDLRAVDGSNAALHHDSPRRTGEASPR